MGGVSQLYREREDFISLLKEGKYAKEGKEAGKEGIRKER
jgi:hypothetical protein